MKADTYKCDCCGTLKGSANHWYIAQEVEGVLMFRPWEPIEGREESHLCGEGCAAKVLAKWMSRRKDGT